MTGILTELLPKPLRLALRGKALIRRAASAGASFRCRALAGLSDFNVCINSDLSVSCNCQDFDGSGRIGDLNSGTLAEIFAGPAARAFRARLAARSFPTPTCASCADLELLPSDDAERLLADWRVPSAGIMVENTARCNLRCPMCDRDSVLALRGARSAMSLEDVERVALELKLNALESVLFFNLGEPFLPGSVREQVALIRRHNPAIRIVTSTNGQLVEGEERVEAALMMDYLYFSIDGVDDGVLGRYQVGGRFERAYRNMKRVVAERNRLGKRAPIVEWKYVLFRWNDRPWMIDRAIELAREAGVDVIGFYRGDGPLRHRSLRWHLDPYFKRLGTRSRGGIVVNLNGIAPDLLSP